MENQIQVNASNHLEIGGCDALQLAQQYGTPLMVYDVSKIRNRIHEFKDTFEKQDVKYAISYASKAFASIAIFQVMAHEGCHIDVVSGGELYTALKAKFPTEKISFHGNNKSFTELEMAVKKIGRAHV